MRHWLGVCLKPSSYITVTVKVEEADRLDPEGGRESLQAFQVLSVTTRKMLVHTYNLDSQEEGAFDVVV